MLVLEDPGGELLEPSPRAHGTEDILVSPSKSRRRSAGAHQQRACAQRDIKPRNIIVNRWPETSNSRVSASSRPARAPVPEPPETIAGTSPIGAPEQTGSNELVCRPRSDLLCTGGTFYQMLTGSLPFRRIRIRWSGVHCQIARRLTTPAERL